MQRQFDARRKPHFRHAKPAYVGVLSENERAALAAHLDHAYRVVFLVIAGVTAVGAFIARTIPPPDWSQRGDSADNAH